MSKHKIQEWMPFYGDDFFQDERVAKLDIEVRYVFIVLLWFQWREGSIIDDPKVLARLSGISERTLKRALKALESMFSKTSEGRLVNAKCDVLRGKSIERVTRLGLPNEARRGALNPPLREHLNPPLRAGDGEGERDRDTLTSVSVNAGARAREVAAVWDSVAATVPGMPTAPAVTRSLERAVADVDRPDVDWQALARRVVESPALNGKQRFTASLGWLLKPDNFAKVEIGAYDVGQRGRVDPKTLRTADAVAEAREIGAALPVGRLLGRKTI